MWHHTASTTSPENDASYMCHGSDSRPVANLLVARDGAVWVLAAGATNTNGKGGPWTWSRGTVPLDSMNTYAVGIEIANGGTGERFPVEQIDATFGASIAVARALGLRPTDVCEHQPYAPTRKIDPATADAVDGPWRPSSCSSSGTWDLDDLVAEITERWNDGTVEPEPEEDDTMRPLLIQAADGPTAGALAVAPPDLSRMMFLSTGDDYQALLATGQYDAVVLSGATFARIPGAEQVQVVP